MYYDPEKITFFAKTDARGQQIPFGIKAKDRQRHMYVIGKTGMGKSTLLENMAVQDIQNGEGMAFIDPHGSAAETLLSYIPEHRINDVLYFAPFDMEHPVSFNIMEDVGADKRHLVVSGLMSVFEKIWVDAWSARMAYILQNTLMALLEYPDSTLLGVNRMLSDKLYREKVVANLKDPGVKSFWVDEFAKYNERYMQEAGDAIKNKIGQFTANPVIRNIIGQPKSSFDIRKIMDERKILIMNLSKGLIGETNANLLGSMLTTRIYLAAMSRADLSPEKMREMPNFYFFVDEFQSFANSTFSNILSEARKYHLNLTIAHQYITQMEEEVKDAVFGNVGTIVAFRVGPFDAEVLETIFAPQFTATDIVNLSFAQIYLTLMIDGIGSQPFSAVTLPPIDPPTISYKDVVTAASRKQFANKRETVEEAIVKFHEPLQAERRPSGNQNANGNGSGNGNGNGNGGNSRRDQGAGNGSFTRGRAPVREGGGQRDVRPQLNGNGNTNGSGSRNGNSDPDRSSAPRERAGDVRRGDREMRKPKEQSLEELRSVLRTIGAENGAQSANKKPEARDAKRSPDTAKTELKDVLKNIVPQEPKPESTEERTSAAAPPSRPTPPTQRERTAETAATPPSPAQPKERTYSARSSPPQNSRISPKELERMMRITTSDKPPI